MRSITSTLLSLLLLLPFAACGEKESTSGRLKVVATTGMIEDAVREVAGDRVELAALMGPGVDPHLYKASQSDLALLTGADIVFYNGLHLEGKMVDALEKMARNRRVVPVAAAIDSASLRRPAEFQGHPDPHVWFDVKMWESAVRAVERTLAEADTAGAKTYHDRAAHYLRRLDSLDSWVRQQIATIPRDRRVLVTAHDAFGYFGRAYDIEVRGLQGISTVTETGLGDISALVEMIVSRKIKAVFVESSVPHRSIEAVRQGAEQRGHRVALGGTLFSDAMGARGTPEGTYIGMVSANVHTIVEALR